MPCCKCCIGTSMVEYEDSEKYASGGCGSNGIPRAERADPVCMQGTISHFCAECFGVRRFSAAFALTPPAKAAGCRAARPLRTRVLSESVPHRIWSSESITYLSCVSGILHAHLGALLFRPAVKFLNHLFCPTAVHLTRSVFAFSEHLVAPFVSQLSQF